MDLLGPLYLRNFENVINELQAGLMFVVYFILLAGLIFKLVRLSETDADLPTMIKPVVAIALVIGIIATLPLWFNRIDRGFVSVAETINANFGSEPFAVTEALMNTVEEDPEAEGFGVERIVNSVYLSIVYGLAKLGITTAALFQIPFLIFQYGLKWLGFLILPIGLSLLTIPSLSSIGIRMISNLLAVLAWPIGFAVTNLAAIGFINDFATASTFTGNNTGGALFMISFGSLLMGIIGAGILIVGTIATPTILFALFNSGAALEGINGAVTGAAAFTAYTVGNSIPNKSNDSDSGSSPAPTSRYDSVGSGPSSFNESQATYGGGPSVIDAGILDPYDDSSPSQSAITGANQKGLPVPSVGDQPSLVGPSNSLEDLSGEQQAAALFALTTTPQAVIDI